MKSIREAAYTILCWISIIQYSLSYTGTSYLSSLTGKELTFSSPSSSAAAAAVNGDSKIEEIVKFHHAPFSYFAINKLTPKGPRKNADVGQPHDATRPLAQDGAMSAGSWWCAAGGWPSPALRATTEVFYVFSGSGALTDLDGVCHKFGPGDTVILPKGWSGRWDVLEDIHKVWAVVDHPNVEEMSNPIRAKIVSNADLLDESKVYEPLGVRVDASHGYPSTTCKTFCETGPVVVGGWTCTPGSFRSKVRSTTEVFHVLEGLFFLTNEDGTAQKIGSGDTIVLPKGWSGHWDVIEPVRKLWIESNE